MRMGWSWQSVKMANRIYGSISRFVWWHGFEIVTIDFLDPVHDCWNRKKQQIVTLRIHSIEYLRRLVDSMPARIEAVIAAKGGMTKY